jgi:hypothetical protein
MRSKKEIKVMIRKLEKEVTEENRESTIDMIMLLEWVLGKYEGLEKEVGNES